MPTFSKLWEEDLGNGVFIAIDDTRSFMARLTRVLFGGIRQVPEQTTKAGSSQGKNDLHLNNLLFVLIKNGLALMDNLRSRSHLFNVITAVKVVAHGPVSYKTIGPVPLHLSNLLVSGYVCQPDASATNTFNYHQAFQIIY